jgi:hypothetical protein
MHQVTASDGKGKGNGKGRRKGGGVGGGDAGRGGGAGYGFAGYGGYGDAGGLDMGAGYGMPPQGWGGGGWPQQAMPYGGLPLPPAPGMEQWEPDVSGLNMRPAAGHSGQWSAQAQASKPMRARLSRTIESAQQPAIRGGKRAARN